MFIVVALYLGHQHDHSTLLLSVIILAIVEVIIILLLIFLRKRLLIAVALIKEASRSDMTLELRGWVKSAKTDQ